MKKFLLIAVAAFGMLMTACSKDEVAQPVAEKSVVTFTVEAPVMQTRATEHGDGKTATELNWAAYDRYAAAGSKPLITGSTRFQPGELTTTVEIPFVNGMTYDILFWAEAPASPYTVNWTTKTVAYTKAAELDSNSQAYDAFYCYFTELGEIAGPVTKTVELKRPFAQLNIITNDADKAEQSGVFVENVAVTVKKGYQAFDFVSGNGINQGAVTFRADAAQAAADAEGVQLLAVNYLFTGSEKSLVDVEFTYTDVNKKLGQNGLTQKYATVPVQRNYRTNIVGSLLTSEGNFNIVTLPGFDGEPGHKYEVVSVATAAELQTALNNPAVGEITLEDNIELNDILEIGVPTRAETEAVVRNLTIDGNGKTLTSSAARAINVSGVDGVTIKNLNIECTGERAINIIQKATNVTIENVTATAANYTVNVAGSAPKAVVDIKGSTLNGLCTVNVAAAGANVTVDDCTVNCNDNNTTEGESYAALSLNKDAVGATITVTNSEINKPEDSDSMIARNGAEDGKITIDGSTDDVTIMVAAITYEGSDYYHAFETIEAAVEFAKEGNTVTLIRDVESSEIIVLNKSIVFDGNDKTLKSTAGRAINVSGADGVTIENLTINCSGERAINIIQNATNVTIENVTATAANYTVNVASSAPNAVVAINNSTLTGLCTVNVSAAGANVTVDGCTVNCNDNNEKENYSALVLTKDAAGASIIVTESTINVSGDSNKASNAAAGGTITIDNSTEGVIVNVAAITYEGSSYYYVFETLEDAIKNAKEGDVITLLRDIKLSENITVANSLVVAEGVEVTLDLNGKTLKGTMHKSVGAVLKNEGTLTVKNGTISSTADNGGSAIQNYGTLTVENATLNGAPNANGSWPSYTVNNTGVMTVNNVTITSHHGAVASYNDGAVVTLNNSVIDMAGIPGFTSHGMYTYSNGKIIVNGGTYANKATDQAASGASVINGAVEVNDGTFTGRIENYYGTPVFKGGTYSVKPNNSFVAVGYKAVDNGNGTWSVVAE